MQKTSKVCARIDADTKKRAEEIYSQFGMNLSDAIKIFLHRSVAVGGLPFDLRVTQSSAENMPMRESTFAEAPAVTPAIESGEIHIGSLSEIVKQIEEKEGGRAIEIKEKIVYQDPDYDADEDEDDEDDFWDDEDDDDFDDDEDDDDEGEEYKPSPEVRRKIQQVLWESGALVKPPEDIPEAKMWEPTTRRIAGEPQKTGRNELCPCGSERKYKHCCGK